MTVRNNYEFLNESINSILNQCEKKFKFIIIDDGSTNDIESLVKSFLDERIQYYKNTKPGLINALNMGVEICDTKYIAIMDSDDIAPSNRLKKQFEFLENNPNIGLVGTSIKYFNKNTNRTSWKIKMPAEHSEIEKNLLKGRYVLVHSSIMCRTNVIKSLGGYKAESFPVPDTDLFLRFAKASNLSNLTDIYSLIRIHNKSHTAANLYQIIKKNYLIVSQPTFKLKIFKDYYSLIFYRKGLYNYLNNNYLFFIFFFFLSFLLSPLRAFYYLTKK